MLLEQTEEKKGVNKILIAGGMVGIVLIAVAIFVMSFRPSMEDQMASILEGSFREGSSEFERITKDIIISTDPRTVQSPNAFGKISMFITGNIRNKGTSVINGLEVNVAVVDSFNAVLREKRVLVVPTQRERLGPEEIIPITLSLDGFDKNDDRANIRWKVTAIRIE
ncbi:MAG: hypothetical protein H7070_14940 [Saprospiraceae bacterium]|nr:hypothetical protein [Pyrinomonadaceae bacterium]